jgi:hypothetical protein
MDTWMGIGKPLLGMTVIQAQVRLDLCGDEQGGQKDMDSKDNNEVELRRIWKQICC